MIVPRALTIFRVLAATALVLGALAVTSVVGSAQDADPPADGSEGPGAVETVTLITGDVVTVEQHPDGRRTVAVEPNPDDDGEVEFETRETPEGFYVVPLEAVPLVPNDLDPELFNIDRLLEVERIAGDGTLPIIVQHQPGPRTHTAPQLGSDRELRSIDATSSTLEADEAAELWSTWTGGSGDGELQGLSTTTVEKIWLDGPVEVSLDDSAPQVGAPAAWDAGYDGDGITVAVLDTGIDATHPDLEGQVAASANFTTSEDGDGHGHGTHVASTVAGTGAGSDGALVGVAPAATLLDGKVLDDAGRGQLSWVIAGMEWAALEQDADVVNLSLGSGPSDGTDPVSLALNQLTEDTGTVFVAAAGNNGPRSRTIGSPAAADAAIAVGSVWSSDFLYSSSSRGPRRGDHAIKPELTAPGVNIVAARAEGTSMGSPVDDLYTSATGTSMAAPHVAGGAAILLQQHPDWGVDELTAALATTGAPHSSFTVYDQGGGRMDLAVATELAVVATPAPLDLGYFPYPHDDAEPVSHELTYTNISDAPVSLSLDLDVADEDGAAPADGMVTLGAEGLTLEPGESDTVTVTVDVTQGEVGLYGGYLEAAQDGTTLVRTPVGFDKEGERYDLSIRGFDADGDPAAGSSSATVMNVDDRDAYFESGISYIDGVASARVPPGTYSITGLTYTDGDDGEVREISALAEPEFEVTEDLEVVLDARDANPITVDTPEHETAPWRRTRLTLYREPAEHPGFSLGAVFGPEGRTFSAAPTDEVAIGSFEFNSRWQLVDDPEPDRMSVLYDVVLPESAVPEDLHYELHPSELATNQQRFHTHVEGHEAQEYRTAWRPWQGVALAISDPIPMPGERTDLLSPGDTSWTRTVLFAPPGYSSFAARMNAPRMQYEPGSEQPRSWFEQPSTPGIIEGSPWHRSFLQYRDGDELDLMIAEYGDAQRGHWSWRHSIDDVAFRLYEDDELIAEASRPRGDFEVSPDERTLRLEVDTARTGLDWWRYSTRTNTAWTFTSSRPEGDEPEVLPLLFVDYDLDVDLYNQAPHPRDRRGPRTLEFDVRHQPGVDAPPEVEGLKLWTSGDDGGSWEAIDNVREIAPGRFRAILSDPDPDETNGAIALRVEAWDADGGRIEQTIERAYGLPERD